MSRQSHPFYWKAGKEIHFLSACFREYRLEGYLFPSTYFLSDEMTAHDLIDMMLTEFDKVYKKFVTVTSCPVRLTGSSSELIIFFINRNAKKPISSAISNRNRNMDTAEERAIRSRITVKERDIRAVEGQTIRSGRHTADRNGNIIQDIRNPYDRNGSPVS